MRTRFLLIVTLVFLIPLLAMPNTAEIDVPGAENALDITLPGGEQVALVGVTDERVDGYLLTGEVEGEPASSAILTVVDDHMVGQITVGGEAYKVTQAPDEDAPTVTRVDTRADRGPGDTDAVIPPAAALEPVTGFAEAGSEGASAPPWEPPIAASVPDDGSRIDVLVLYTQDLANTQGASLPAAIQNQIDLSNQSFQNSGVNTAINLVGTELFTEGSVAESIAENPALANLRNSSGAQSLRDSYGADMVTLMRSEANAVYCGIGYVMTSLTSAFGPWAYSLVNYDLCGDGLTLVHELGHNFGSDHDLGNGSVDGGLYSYSNGHDNPGIFATVMSYDSPNIPYMSNPSVNYLGHPTGIVEGQPGEADNTKSVNLSKGTVANFRAEVTPIPSTSSVWTPATPDGLNDWFLSSPSVELSVSVTGDTQYQWNSTGDGGWTAYSTVVAAPEGSNTLYYRSYNATGTEDASSEQVKVDSVSPTNPNMSSVTHSESVPSVDPDITMQWDVVGGGKAVDASSGVDGYSHLFSTDSLDDPDTAKDAEEGAFTTGQTLSVGDWYFHLRTVDNAGNWSATQHAGPYQILAPPPTFPDLVVNGVVASEYSPENGDTVQMTVEVENVGDASTGSTFSVGTTDNWGAGPLSSGAVGPLSPGQTIDVVIDWSWGFEGTADVTATADSLAEVSESDENNNSYTSSEVTIVPVVVDTTPPSNPSLSSPSHAVGVLSVDTTIEVDWPTSGPGSASDDSSGVDGFSFSWSEGATEDPGTSKDGEQALDGVVSGSRTAGNWFFNLRTKDNAGNWNATTHMGPFVIGVTEVLIWPRWSSAPFGYWSKLAGTVTDGAGSPIIGESVRLEYEDGSTWKWLKNVTTGSTGYYQHWFYYEGGTRTYRARHMSSGLYSNLTTPTFTKSITAWNNYRPQVRYCQWTKVQGKYGGPTGVYPNKTLYMQRWTGSAWAWQATVTTNSTGYYAAWASVCPTTQFRMATAGSVVTSLAVTKTGTSIASWQNTKVHASIKDGYGDAIRGMKLYLQKWNGSSWTWQATCTTSPTGYCSFGNKNPTGLLRVATGGSKVVSETF